MPRRCRRTVRRHGEVQTCNGEMVPVPIRVATRHGFATIYKYKCRKCGYEED